METVTAAVEYLEGINLASITMRIVMSMVCGGVIGIERGKAHQPAGMRTYMLVCMGAAMVMLTGQYMYYHFQPLILRGWAHRWSAESVSWAPGASLSRARQRLRG